MAHVAIDNVDKNTKSISLMSTIVSSPNDIEEYCLAFEDNKVFKSDKRLILLVKQSSEDAQDKNYIEKIDLKQSNEILILGRHSEKKEERDDLYYKMREYQNHYKNKGFLVSTRWCNPQIMEVLFARYERIEQNNRIGLEAQGKMEKILNDILIEAKDKGASDIHIEVRADEAIIRYRIHGELMYVTTWSTEFAKKFCQVVYMVLSENKDTTFKPDQPQDALVERRLKGERVRIRLATIPASPDGYDVVMRILSLGRGGEEDKKITSLADLGYSKNDVKSIYIGISKPVGATIIAGTTGSGKSTTQKNLLLSKIKQHKGGIKVITVEDPPEYYVPGATQVPVVRNKNMEKSENPFAAAMRAAMRCDPDILMAGEVRDPVSAKLLVSAVQSGHQVLTTVHAPSAISIIGRLENLGISRGTLGAPDFIACLIYQALLPVLCTHCKIKMSEIDEDVNPKLNNDFRARMDILNIELDKIYTRGKGCEHCSNGIDGRTVVAETLLPDYEMLGFFHEGKDIEALMHWRENGGKLIAEHGIEKVISGSVCPFDAEDKLGPLTTPIITEDRKFNLKQELPIAGSDMDNLASKSIEENVMSLDESVSQHIHENEFLQDDYFSDIDPASLSLDVESYTS